MIKLRDILCESLVNQYDRFPLSALVKRAQEFDSFDEFEMQYQAQIDHGYWWHITKNPDFTIRSDVGPRDMSSMASGGAAELGALMMTSNLERWDYEYNIDRQTDKRKINRPYAVLIDASDVPYKQIRQVNRGFGNEVSVNAFNAKNLKIVGVYKLQYARTLDKKFGEIIPYSSEQLHQLYDYAHNLGR